MTESVPDIREFILRQCAAAAPNPWFPSAFAREHAISRDQLDRHLDELRLGGLVRIADWVQGMGQGYSLTPDGASVLQSSRDLARLNSGKLELTPTRQSSQVETTPGQGTAWDRGEMVRDAVLYPPQPLVTRALILANVLVFVYGIILAVQNRVPLNEFLFGRSDAVSAIDARIGALEGVMIARGEWFRLLTCCFVHFGLLHLAVNMYSLYVLGRIQEGMWGRLRYLALYLIAGVGGSCAMVINNPRTFGAGASGAIFGLMGALATWIFLNRRFLGAAASIWLRRLFMVFVLNVFISAMPGISASAHFGGLGVGIVAAVLLNFQRFGRGAVRWLALMGLLALPVISVGAVIKAMSADPRWRQPELIESTREAAEWKRDIRLKVEAIWREVERLENNEVNAKRDRAAKGSDAKTDNELVSVLNVERSRLQEALRLLKNAGPFNNAAFEEERQLYLKGVEIYLEIIETKIKLREAELRLSELTEQRTRQKSNWTEQNEQEFHQQNGRINELKERLRELRRRL